MAKLAELSCVCSGSSKLFAILPDSTNQNDGRYITLIVIESLRMSSNGKIVTWLGSNNFLGTCFKSFDLLQSEILLESIQKDATNTTLLEFWTLPLKLV